MQTPTEVKGQGLELLHKFAGLAKVELNVMASYAMQQDLASVVEELTQVIRAAENYPNKAFIGLAEATARCLILYDTQPDAYAELVLGCIGRDGEEYLDTYEGLLRLCNLAGALADDHDYCYNRETGTIEVAGPTPTLNRYLTPQEFLRLLTERMETYSTSNPSSLSGSSAA